MQIADIDFCRPADADALYAIERACFDTPWERHILERDLAEQGTIVYMKALFKGTIVGYGVLERKGALAHLLNLAVLEDYRRQGIASQLMLAFDEIASSAWCCRRMRLEVRSSNRAARDFYARLGFCYAKRIRGYYAGREDALILIARMPLNVC